MKPRVESATNLMIGNEAGESTGRWKLNRPHGLALGENDGTERKAIDFNELKNVQLLFGDDAGEGVSVHY
jgi:hypothetical protein